MRRKVASVLAAVAIVAAATGVELVVVKHSFNHLVDKDASRQAQGLVAMLADRPECEVFKTRLLDAGKGPPADGATQWQLAHARQDACTAGCCTR